MSSQCYVLYVLYCTYLRLGYGALQSTWGVTAAGQNYPWSCLSRQVALPAGILPAEPALARSLMYDQGLSGLLWCYGCQYCHVHIALAAELQRPILNGSVVVC
eukprot:scpid104810/ scgid25564/ 